MDDIIKLLQQLMSQKPKPKGGIADSAEGIEFLGKQLSKEQRGNFVLIGSKLTDASRFKPFAIQNVGRDKRYVYMKDYEKELTAKFNQTIEFLKANPDIRLTQLQKDNIYYNLGVLRRTTAEKNKLEKGIFSEGKQPDDIYKNYMDNKPFEDMTMGEQVTELAKTNEKLKKAIKETEDIFKVKVDPEKVARLDRLYYGRGYKAGSDVFRGLGGHFLPKLHEAGIIKMDDAIYDRVRKGEYHYADAKFRAPDPVRIWRYHFGDDIFDKMDDWDYNDGESVFDWIKRNNIQPIKREGPPEALDYMHPVELKQELTEDLELFNVYKKPDMEKHADYFQIDNPKFRMDRIMYHGENIDRLEKALQRVSVDDYKQYVKEKPVVEGTVVPFKDLNAKGGRVGFRKGTPKPTPEQGLGSLTPQQKFYTDKIIRDNMDAIREDMRLYFDDKTEYEKFIESITDEDIYGIYDERKGYDSVFKKSFTTKDGRKIPIPYKPDKEIDTSGLLQLFDEFDEGTGSYDSKKFKSGDILGSFSNKEREV